MDKIINYLVSFGFKPENVLEKEGENYKVLCLDNKGLHPKTFFFNKLKVGYQVLKVNGDFF